MGRALGEGGVYASTSLSVNGGGILSGNDLEAHPPYIAIASRRNAAPLSDRL